MSGHHAAVFTLIPCEQLNYGIVNCYIIKIVVHGKYNYTIAFVRVIVGKRSSVC